MAHALVGSVVQLTQQPISPLAIVERKKLNALMIQAAKIIEEDAGVLKECHTIDGKWSSDEPAARRTYDRMMRVARKLRKATG